MRVQRLHRPIAIACFAACSWFTSTAQAAAGTWRCGNTYTDQPCAGGQAVPMDAAPGTERVRDAEENTRRAQASAARMEAERIRRERERPAMVHLPGPSIAKPAAETPPNTGRKTKAHQTPEVFKAAGPGSTKAPRKKKAVKVQAVD